MKIEKEKSKEELQLEEIETTMAKLKQQQDELKKTIKEKK